MGKKSAASQTGFTAHQRSIRIPPLRWTRHSTEKATINPPRTNPLKPSWTRTHPPRFSKNLTQGWFVNVLPDLNTENPVVAQYLLQNSIWWAETTGLDGYRLDTFPYVPRKFWAAWHLALRRLYPNLTTIGEVFHPDPSVTSFFMGGQKRYDGIDSGVTTLFDFPLYFTLRDVLLRGAPAGKIAEILRHDSLYNRPDSLVTFFGNHDVTRFANASARRRRTSPGRRNKNPATGLWIDAYPARNSAALLRR